MNARRKGIMKWILWALATGLIGVLAIGLYLKGIHSMEMHRMAARAVHEGAFAHGYPGGFMERGPAFSGHAGRLGAGHAGPGHSGFGFGGWVVTALIGLALVAAGCLLWKRAGRKAWLEWAAGFVVLAGIMFLTGPIGALIAAVIAFLVYRRIQANRMKGSTAGPQPASYGPAPTGQGHLLDEWERNTLKEDK